MSDAETSIDYIMTNTLVQIVIAALVFIILFTYINDIGSDDYFERNYIARDLALTIEAIQTPQGNTVIPYAKETDTFSFLMRDGRMHVFDAVDQPEPPLVLRGISSFSIGNDMSFEDTELRYLGFSVQPVLVKTNNKVVVSTSAKDYKQKMYSYIDAETKDEAKDRVFSADGDESLKEYVKALVEQLNIGLNAGYSYSDTGANIIVAESNNRNIIYAPSTEEGRELASRIANKFIEGGDDVLIMPSGNDIFMIMINKGLEQKLTNILIGSLEEYYDT